MEMYGKDRKRQAEKRVRRHLTSKILILIIVFILPLNLIFFLTVQRSIGKVEQQIRLSLQNAADVYMDALDKDMERVDYYLYSSYISNTDFVTLLNTKDELQYQNAKYRCIRDMQDEISLSLNCELLFYYHGKRDEYIMSCGEGGKKEKFCSFLKENMENKPEWIIAQVKEKDYLVRITKVGNVYYGAFINIEDFVQRVSSSVNYESVSVSMTKKQEEGGREKAIIASQESIRADARLCVKVTTKEIVKMLSVWEWGMAVMAILSIGMIPLLYMVLKKWVLSPLKELNYAHHELEIGNEGYRIEKEGNSLEFLEAYRSFNEMADNIYSLKLENMEKKLAAKQLALNNLQLQIRPHFLLNTFNLMFNLASEKDVENIKELVLYLSGYFRHIFHSGKELELFQKELTLIEGYMKAAKLRYPGMLDISYQIDPEVCLVRVPPLLIHNFIENVVKHALIKDRVIHIMLTAEYTNGEVNFVVSDNGAGMEEEKVRMINEGKFMENEERIFVGLRNAAMRLRYFYGETAYIRVESELNYGTVFTVAFPYDLEEE